MGNKYHNNHQKGLVQLMFGACGIYFSYILLSIFSQKLYSSVYQSNHEFSLDGTPVTQKFTHPNMIVWLSGLCCAVLGQIKGWIIKQPKSTIPTKQKLILGALFAVNMTATNFALLYISYPTHALCSNSRYLLIVLIGAYFSRVSNKDDLKLPKHKLYVAIFITIGVIFFNILKLFSTNQGKTQALDEQWKGFLLIFVSMLAEALFCDNQAYNKSKFRPTANHFFKSANFYSFLFSAILSLISGTLFSGIQFVFSHPQCLKQILLLCSLQVTGQLSIYYIVTNFKQHIFPLISATRKIITVVCSILIFNHNLSALQWICVAMVFGGMIYEVSDEVMQKKRKNQKLNPQITNQKYEKNEIKEE